MTIVERPRTRKHAVRVHERINLLDFFGVDNFHAETDVIRDALHEMKPVNIILRQGETNTP